MDEGDKIEIEGEKFTIKKNPYWPQATVKWRLEP